MRVEGATLRGYSSSLTGEVLSVDFYTSGSIE